MFWNKVSDSVSGLNILIGALSEQFDKSLEGGSVRRRFKDIEIGGVRKIFSIFAIQGAAPDAERVIAIGRGFEYLVAPLVINNQRIVGVEFRIEAGDFEIAGPSSLPSSR